MKSKYITKSLKAIYGSWFSYMLKSKNAIALEKLIFLENKDHMYDRNLTLITMVQTVFEIFMILSKIIQLQSSLHSKRIFQSTITLWTRTRPNELIFYSLQDVLKSFWKFENFTKSRNEAWVSPIWTFHIWSTAKMSKIEKLVRNCPMRFNQSPNDTI